MKSKIDRLDAIHPDLISAFLTGGKGEGIPVDIQSFLKQLQWAAERKLRLRINAEQGERIEERTCMSRIYQAINYFNVDCNVPIKVWENNFANKYEDLAKICAVQRDYKSQKACYDAALECRRRASEVAEADRGLGVTFILSPEITAEEMGFAKRNLKEIAAKHNRGFYLNLIESLPLEKAEKKRLLRDADIEEAEIVQDIDND